MCIDLAYGWGRDKRPVRAKIRAMFARRRLTRSDSCSPRGSSLAVVNFTVPGDDLTNTT
jgi:hypothetical protein